MKITKAEIIENNPKLLAQIILTSFTTAAGKTVNKDDTEFEIQLLFNDEPLEIEKFFEGMAKDWESAITREAKNQATVLLNEWKQSWRTKNSGLNKLESIKKQLDKASNTLKNMNHNINNYISHEEGVRNFYDQNDPSDTTLVISNITEEQVIEFKKFINTQLNGSCTFKVVE